MNASELVQHNASRQRSLPPLKHARCTQCYGGLEVVTTFCGLTMPWAPRFRRADEPLTIPPDTCVVCADLLSAGCERCGWTWQ